MAPEPTRSKRKRAAVLDAAVAEFERSGFRDTSMDRIAERAQVSKRTVYHHFCSKEELFHAIVAELLDRAREAVGVPYDADDDLEPQLRELGRQEAELVSSKNFLSAVRVLLAEAVRSPKMVKKALGSLQTEEDGVTRWVRAAAADGRLSLKHPEAAAEQFVSLIKGALFWPQVTGLCSPAKKSERTSVIESATRMFLDHYEVRP